MMAYFVMRDTYFSFKPYDFTDNISVLSMLFHYFKYVSKLVFHVWKYAPFTVGGLTCHWAPRAKMSSWARINPLFSHFLHNVYSFFYDWAGSGLLCGKLTENINIGICQQAQNWNDEGFKTSESCDTGAFFTTGLQDQASKQHPL